MADGVEIHISGLADLERSLLQIAGPGAKRAVRKGLRAGGNVIKAEAKARVPVRTGLLKRSIAVRPKRRGTTRTTMAFETYVRRRAFYGKFIEFGTSRMAARPFMRPAVESAHHSAIEAIRDVTLAQVVIEAMKATL